MTLHSSFLVPDPLGAVLSGLYEEGHDNNDQDNNEQAAHRGAVRVMVIEVVEHEREGIAET